MRRPFCRFYRIVKCRFGDGEVCDSEVLGIAIRAYNLLRLRALRKDKMVNNNENASSSDTINDIVFRLKCMR
jgi:hypothetical protein